MRRFQILGAMLIVACSSFVALATGSSTAISGDYVEARTASVFAGACHYNGEVVTVGRDAVMAWHIKSGQWNGVNLAGLRAVAVVAAQNNLDEEDGARQSEIVIDSRDDAQAAAFVDVLRTRHAAALGKIVSVRRDSVTFRHEKGSYRVEAAKFATLAVSAMPNSECCKMPHMVWYAPLVRLTDRKVGYTAKATYAGGALGDPWERGRENSAFYGSLSL